MLLESREFMMCTRLEQAATNKRSEDSKCLSLLRQWTAAMKYETNWQLIKKKKIQTREMFQSGSAAECLHSVEKGKS